MKKSFYKRVVLVSKARGVSEDLRARSFYCMKRSFKKWAKRQVNKAERRKLK